MWDFNEITCQSEKCGYIPRPYKQMEIFKEALEFCDLSDVKAWGPSFTWSNNRTYEGFTKEMLDRVVANLEWHQLFSSFIVLVLLAIKSNHCSLHLVIFKSSNPNLSNRNNSRRDPLLDRKLLGSSMKDALIPLRRHVEWDPLETLVAKKIKANLICCKQALKKCKHSSFRNKQGSIRNMREL